MSVRQHETTWFPLEEFLSTLILLILLIFLLITIWLTPGGSIKVHIYWKKIYRTTQLTTLLGRLSWIRTKNGPTKINDNLTVKI
jgi:hypothetical protein